MSSTEARDPAAGAAPSRQAASGSRAEGAGRVPPGRAEGPGPHPARHWMVAGVVVVVAAAVGAVLAAGLSTRIPRLAQVAPPGIRPGPPR